MCIFPLNKVMKKKLRRIITLLSRGVVAGGGGRRGGCRRRGGGDGEGLSPAGGGRQGGADGSTILYPCPWAQRTIATSLTDRASVTRRALTNHRPRNAALWQPLLLLM